MCFLFRTKQQGDLDTLGWGGRRGVLRRRRIQGAAGGSRVHEPGEKGGPVRQGRRYERNLYCDTWWLVNWMSPVSETACLRLYFVTERNFTDHSWLPRSTGVNIPTTLLLPSLPAPTLGKLQTLRKTEINTKDPIQATRSGFGWFFNNLKFARMGICYFNPFVSKFSIYYSDPQYKLSSKLS